MPSTALMQAWTQRLGTFGVEPPEVGVARVRYAQRFGVFLGPNIREVDGTTIVTKYSHPPQTVYAAPGANAFVRNRNAYTGAPRGDKYPAALGSRFLSYDRATSDSADIVSYGIRQEQARRESFFHDALFAWLNTQLPTVPTDAAVRAWVDAWTPPAELVDAD